MAKNPVNTIEQKYKELFQAACKHLKSLLDKTIKARKLFIDSPNVEEETNFFKNELNFKVNDDIVWECFRCGFDYHKGPREAFVKKILMEKVPFFMDIEDKIYADKIHKFCTLQDKKIPVSYSQAILHYLLHDDLPKERYSGSWNNPNVAECKACKMIESAPTFILDSKKTRIKRRSISHGTNDPARNDNKAVRVHKHYNTPTSPTRNCCPQAGSTGDKKKNENKIFSSAKLENIVAERINNKNATSPTRNCSPEACSTGDKNVDKKQNENKIVSFTMLDNIIDEKPNIKNANRSQVDHNRKCPAENKIVSFTNLDNIAGEKPNIKNAKKFQVDHNQNCRNKNKIVSLTNLDNIVGEKPNIKNENKFQVDHNQNCNKNKIVSLTKLDNIVGKKTNIKANTFQVDHNRKCRDENKIVSSPNLDNILREKTNIKNANRFKVDHNPKFRDKNKIVSSTKLENIKGEKTNIKVDHSQKYRATPDKKAVKINNGRQMNKFKSISEKTLRNGKPDNIETRKKKKIEILN